MTARKLLSNQRNKPGGQKNSYGSRVISVKLGDKTRRVSIDGSGKTILKTIKSAFGLRTKRAFWLEDVDNIVRTPDRDMPLGNYTIHQDEGLMIKIRGRPKPSSDYIETSEDSEEDSQDSEDHQDSEKIFYTEDDFRDFLSFQGLMCLREFNSLRKVYLMNELSSGGIYYGLTNE